MKDKRTGDEEEPMTIDEKTGISVKVLIALMGLVLTATIAVGALQFNGAKNMVKIETKLDMLMGQINRNESESERASKVISDHMNEASKLFRDLETRMTVIEESGSKSVHELQSKFNDLDVRMRVIEKGLK